MPEQRWIWIAVAAGVVVALIAGFVIGRATASDTSSEVASPEATTVTTTTTLPEYGDEAARAAYVSAVNGSLGAGSAATDQELLAAGDSLCADLAGFTPPGERRAVCDAHPLD